MSYYGDRGGGGGDRGRDSYRGGGGGGYDRDRSRSRDPGGGRYGGRDGGGRYGGGRSGGRGRGPPRPRTTTEEVITNYYALERSNPVGKNEVVQYFAAIKDAINKKDPETGELKVRPRKEDDKGMDMTRSSAISRRILQQLARKEGFFYVTDGSATVFAPERIFPPSESPRTFQIKVKHECEDDEPDADRARQKWFLVTLTEVGVFPKEGDGKDDELEKMRQAMDIVQKHALHAVGLKSYGRNPRSFYFDDAEQGRIMDGLRNSRNGGKIAGIFDRERLFQPIIGITQSVRICENNKIYLNTDTVVDFADREFAIKPRGRDNNGNGNHHHAETIPLIDSREGKVVGVRVNDLHSPIDDRAKNDIEEALKKIRFNVHYVIPPNDERREQMIAKGRTVEEYNRGRTQIRRNQSVRHIHGTNSGIIWRPAEYKFEMKVRGPPLAEGEEPPPPREITVAAYYKERYNMELRYPHLPLIHIGRNNMMPMEFLFRASGKMKGANATDQVQAVLGYYDEKAGFECVNNISQLARIACEKLEQNGVSFTSILERFNLRRNPEPQRIMAKVLTEPKLAFSQNQPARVNNGSWNLMNARFQKPSELYSFAVVDLAGNARKKSGEFMSNLFQAAKNHTIEIVANIDTRHVVDEITVVSRSSRPGTGDIRNAFREALQKARNFFLYDTAGAFSRNNCWFKSRTKNPEGALVECLVLPPPAEYRTGEVGLILRVEQMAPTHNLTNKDGETVQARQMVLIEETTQPIDPFDIMYDARERCHKAKRDDKWVNVRFKKMVYQLKNSTTVDPNETEVNPMPIVRVDLNQVECPSLVFVYLPDETTETYHFVKLLAQFEFGVQSQCVVSTKFCSQKRPEQYCSNIALKVNAKLSNSLNRACAWGTSNGSESAGIPWVNETQTMVMGISASNGIGQDTMSVITGSVCLDTSCMQFAQDIKVQTKTELIDEKLLKDLVKTLITQYRLYNNGYFPHRMLVYRDGVSEGSFARVRSLEIETIRNAFNELSGSIPLITFAVCMTQHRVRVVPAEQRGGKDRNVPSGTCVDNTIMDINNRIKPDDDPKFKTEGLQKFNVSADEGYDFLLTAQGGLKGTSKPIYYRVILNENAEYGRPNTTPLTKDRLELATYQMSFQYSTATKAVRAVPVVFYSARLAKVVMGYINYLRGMKGNDDAVVDMIELDDVPESEKEHLPKARDGKVLSRHMYVRKDLNKADVEPFLKTGMLKAFNPSGSGGRTVPFFTHISC